MRIGTRASQKGQSLIEIIIAVAVGGLIVGSAVAGIAFLLRGQKASQYVQTAAGLSRETILGLSAVAENRWHDIYDLAKDTKTYYVNAFGASLIFLEGKEGVLGDNISDGLVMHLKFDEADSHETGWAYDGTQNRYDGRLGSGKCPGAQCDFPLPWGNVGQWPTNVQNCKVSNCLNFDGANDYVGIPDAFITRNNDTAYTIAAWVKPEQPNTSIIMRTSGYGPKAHWSHQLNYTAGGVFEHYTFDQGTGYWGTPRSVFGTTPVVPNTWYFVVGTADEDEGANGKMRLYVNGKEEGIAQDIYDLWTGGDRYLIGAGSKSPATGWLDTGDFKGQIDDVRVYNRALAADEIYQLYNSAIYTRYFTVKNVFRDNSGFGNIALSGTDDPSTQEINVTLKWNTPSGESPPYVGKSYLTRNKNDVFWQSDWSGGPSANSTHATSGWTEFDSIQPSNSIDLTSPGKIKIQGFPDF